MSMRSLIDGNVPPLVEPGLPKVAEGERRPRDEKLAGSLRTILDIDQKLTTGKRDSDRRKDRPLINPIRKDVARYHCGLALPVVVRQAASSHPREKRSDFISTDELLSSNIDLLER